MRIAILSLMLSISALAHSNESVGKGELKSTAIIENSCFISADNVFFGQVFSPLTTQGSQSNMRVLCNNNTSYKIDLAYGGVYGTGSSNSDYSIKYVASNSFYTSYSVLNDKNTSIGQMNCQTNGMVYFSSVALATLYGYEKSGVFQNDSKKACRTNGRIDGTMPTGWVGAYNASGSQSLGGPAYAYGVMNGGLKGDSLAYKITVPGDNSKVWNVGNNSYTSTGTGLTQVIDVNAQIVPGNSTSLYPAQDMYTDTVTAVISYSLL